ncbi:MAG: HNH endonuclease signature motif containing protein, partial [Acidimicrobiia bacterium]
RAQRRALRAMYKTCAIGGCEVEFDHCDAHHIHPWEHGGTSDLRNFTPQCGRHHPKIHAEGWELAMDDDRTLHVTLPDGTELPRAGPNRHRD